MKISFLYKSDYQFKNRSSSNKNYEKGSSKHGSVISKADIGEKEGSSIDFRHEENNKELKCVVRMCSNTFSLNAIDLVKW